MLLQPARYVVVVVLLAPQHPSQSLAEDATPVLVEIGRGERLVEGIGLGPAPHERPVEAVAEGRARGGGGTQSQAHACRATGRDLQPVVRRSLGADCRRVNGVGPPVQQEVIDPVFDEAAWILAAEQTAVIGLVVGEKQLRRAFALQVPDTEFRMAGGDGTAISRQHGLLDARLVGPEVAEPQRRQQVQGCRLWPTVVHRQQD